MAYSNFRGLNAEVATFNCDSSVTTKGQLVKMSGSGSVSKCADGDLPIGVTVNVKNGYAAVQIRGFAEIAQDGTISAVGYQSISACDDQTLASNTTNGIEKLVLERSTDKVGILF